MTESTEPDSPHPPADEDEAAGPEAPLPEAPAPEAQPTASAPPAGAGDRQRWYHSSGRPQALRWLAEDFAASFAALGSTLLRGNLHVRLTAAARSFRSHVTPSLEEMTSSYVLAAWPGEARGGRPRTICLHLSPAIALSMVERLLGASTLGPPVPDRPLTAAERRVLGRLAEAAAVGLSGAWPRQPRPRFRAELRPVPAGGTCREQHVVTVTFELAFSGRLGTMSLCAGGGVLDELVAPDLAHRHDSAPLELSAALEGIALDEADIAGLAEGDVVATDIPADGDIIVRVGGIPKFAARLGMTDGRKVLTIRRRLDRPGPPPEPPREVDSAGGESI